jgi:hypothetical protein
MVGSQLTESLPDFGGAAGGSEISTVAYTRRMEFVTNTAYHESMNGFGAIVVCEPG